MSDKLILKPVDVVSHGQVSSREKLRTSGEAFCNLVKCVAKRTTKIGKPGHRPILHVDVYAWLGLEIGMEVKNIADFVARLSDDPWVTGFILDVRPTLGQPKLSPMNGPRLSRFSTSAAQKLGLWLVDIRLCGKATSGSFSSAGHLAPDQFA
ncbi:hypothetical protein [Bradyrhizobium archetypum]|uniref:Methylaspartate ammonia-lyase C-terminal domain-containing protein n=1 Tax=Bradyrhizobium archetypum TaxID=2721160 RepID=A0A7Y4HCM1_9BRAD|nr:hypothetical protein [Bradyrhizobium archetypum]NOJ50832.1 hypothetical protein [Bradyrhizobium archetypum]